MNLAPPRGRCLALWLLVSAPLMAQTPDSSDAANTPASETADATKLRCAHGYEMSQRLRQDGKLQKAREQALSCAQTTCPAVLRADCTTWMAELDSAIASVVVDVRDAHGQPVLAAQVSVDGAALTRSLDGRALPLDPGERHFRVILPSGQLLERNVVVNEGKKGQYLRFDVPPVATQPPATSRQLSPWAYGATATAVMGGVGFAYFGLQGRAEEQRLDDACAPSCSRSDVSALRRTYVAADVSLGVGIAALGVLSYLWLTSTDEAHSAVAASASNDGAGLQFRRRF